ncbi:MAG TPA: TlpA disulfide reductase family protein [Bryobacteraceae bacterium]|nr:TlpA disulfide reductase family protein [Bryobacteraceae bacterium]
MRLIASTAFLALALPALTVPALATPPVPRKTPEFTIMDPSGKQTLISSYKGKVLVLPFMFTTCPHCQAYAKVLTKIQNDYASKGVQVLGTVFNDANGAMATQFVKEFGVGFPVGYANRDAVISYLGISVMERWVVPQVVVIDRKGNIVAQSDATQGSPQLQEEASLRAFLDKLLKESATTSTAAPKKAVAKAE